MKDTLSNETYYVDYRQICGSVMAARPYYYTIPLKKENKQGYKENYPISFYRACAMSEIPLIERPHRLVDGTTMKHPRYKETYADCVVGTKEELENWIYYIYNNSLPLCLSLILNHGQHNNIKEFIPWLTDKKYTDEEIYKLLNFTDEEIKLINKTLKKFHHEDNFANRFHLGKHYERYILH